MMNVWPIYEINQLHSYCTHREASFNEQTERMSISFKNGWRRNSTPYTRMSFVLATAISWNASTADLRVGAKFAKTLETTC